MDYRPRIIDAQARRYLDTFGAVCIEGAKWCGKTWTSLHHAESHIFLGSPENNFSNRQLAQMSPTVVLQGATPRLIDEWQESPSIWDAVRHEVDQRGSKGQFLLTGSATPVTKGVMHSGAGRIGTLRMRPMTLFESGHSSGAVSMANLLHGQLNDQMTGDVDLEALIDHILRGGWPGIQDDPLDNATLLAAEYLTAVITSDVSKLDGTAHNTHKVRLLLRSLARNESTTVSARTLARDIKEHDDGGVDPRTISTYLDALERLFLVDDVPPFAPGLRSSTRVKGAAKRHLVDPSLASSLLGATPAILLSDLETLGFLFEALCTRDLRIYAEAAGARVFHYQDYANRAIDAVVETPDRTWHAVEITLGAGAIDAAAHNLLRVAEAIAVSGGTPPSTLTVLCGLTTAAYRRPDGVGVVPLTALGP